MRRMTKVAAVEEEEEADEEETDEKFQVLKRALFHVGLSLSLIGYIFLGAELFRRIEGPVEVAFRHGAEREHEHQVSLLIRRLQRLVPNSGPNETFDMFNRRFEAVFDAYEAHLFELFAHPLKSTLFERSGRQQQQEGASDYRLWTFESAMLFTTTTIIPVGFGHVTPVSASGRFLVVVYSVIGLPLALFTLSNLGRFLYALLFRLMGESVQLVGWALFLLLLAYPFATAVAISQWGEQQMPLTDSVYFCISAIFTIGFGDLLPSIPLALLLAFLVCGVVLVTVSVDVLGTEVIHQIHFAGRQIGRARHLAVKVVEAAQRMQMAKKGLGMGLAVQMEVFARLGQGAALRRLPSTNQGLLRPPRNRQSLAFEPSIELEFVDEV